jgi:uncharacterized protein
MTPARTSQRKRAGIGRLSRRHPLVAFFAIAFALTWAALPWNSFMAAGPMLAAIIVTAVADGRPGLRRLRKRVFHWRVAWQWYAAAVLIPIALALGTGGIDVLFGAPGSVIRNLQLSSLAAVFATRLLLPVGAPVGEEPGWRGFALPRLEQQYGPLPGSLILGLLHGTWHLPVFFLTIGPAAMGPFNFLGLARNTVMIYGPHDHLDLGVQ